jgi:hypothetical protein
LIISKILDIALNLKHIKMKMKSALKLFCMSVIIYSCGSPNPNLDNKGEDELKALEIERTIGEAEQRFQDIVYVPIYSDIYASQQDQKILLAATLSIRNTSENDSLFISRIDYFNTEGNLVRSYIDNLISLPPMATINYVIEKEDDTGGPGANFIVELNSRNRKIKPLIQAIMVGYGGNKAFSFSTDGYSIKQD